jgi:hypothetical protein
MPASDLVEAGDAREADAGPEGSDWQSAGPAVGSSPLDGAVGTGLADPSPTVSDPVGSGAASSVTGSSGPAAVPGPLVHDPDAVTEPRQVTMRRAPRYRAFVLTGLAIGVVIAALLVQWFPDRGQYSSGSVFGYLAVSLGFVGALVAAGLAVLLERPRR